MVDLVMDSSGKHVVVIAGPSGSGKNVIIEELLKRFPRCVRAVTATTRAPRPGEQDGVDYHFFTKEKFEADLASGNIPEHRFVPSLGTYYGFYLPDLEEKLKTHPVVFAQVDVQALPFVKSRFNATTFFIMPESIEQFRDRLRARNPEWSEQEFEARMQITERELKEDAPQFDYRVVNADGALEKAVDEIIEILKKEGYTLD
ncbi:hypothetical protein C4568_05025 [Candidatus Parcubacteria bacterium]|nr:MAG: hypothetical protein C4568_05025 [Candidatus Parcubacteria bacterium]